jgi:hypothetical protein
LRRALSQGPTLQGATAFLDAAATFEGWKEPLTLPQLTQIQREFSTTHNLQRCPSARALLDPETHAVRVRRATVLFRWGDENRDDQLSSDEFQKMAAKDQ